MRDDQYGDLGDLLAVFDRMQAAGDVERHPTGSPYPSPAYREGIGPEDNGLLHSSRTGPDQRSDNPERGVLTMSMQPQSNRLAAPAPASAIALAASVRPGQHRYPAKGSWLTGRLASAFWFALAAAAYAYIFHRVDLAFEDPLIAFCVPSLIAVVLAAHLAPRTGRAPK